MAAALVGFISGPPPAAAQPAATGIRIGEHPQSTRFVMDVSEDIGYRVFTLADPYRVVVDTPELDWQVELATKRAG